MRESHGLFLKEVFLYFVCTEIVASANYFTRCIIAVEKGVREHKEYYYSLYY